MNPKIFQLARFLIREGIKDVITGVKATINGEEISFKSYAIEKGISITCFALEYFTGNVSNIDNNFRDKLLSVVKGECFNLAKRYGNNYVANKIVKNLIGKMSDKIKDYLITPLMDLIAFKGENNDKFIQFDIINDSDVYRNEILKRTQIFLDQTDNIIDFIGPLIDTIYMIKSDSKTEKFTKFLDFISTFDFKGLCSISDKIHEVIKSTEINVEINNNLSYLVKNANSNLSDEEIDEICKELIECGIVNKEGKFNEKFVKINNFKQSFEIKIDEKYSKIEFNNRKISKDLEIKLCFILLKISENALNDKKKKIKDEIY